MIRRKQSQTVRLRARCLSCEAQVEIDAGNRTPVQLEHARGCESPQLDAPSRMPLTYDVNRRTLVPGETEVKVRGESGIFRYVGLSTSQAGNVSLAFYGGAKGRETIRNFRPERVRTVHRKKKMRPRKEK